MAIELYELAVRIKSEGFKAVEKDIESLDKKGRGVTKAFTALKATLITGAVGGFIRKIAVESIEAQKQAAQLNAVIKSTGGIAGVSADEIDKMAASLQRTTVFGDDAVKSAASLLLTFTNIRGEVFRNTLPAITDLATAMGTDLNSAAIQVGKALNDPIKGVSALQRVGVSFSAAQKDVIKNLVETNRLAEAQGVILKELNVQFGGSAQAARNTLGGALTALQNSWNDLFEVTQDSSEGIIGAINSLTDSLPEVRRKFDSFFSGLKQGFTGLKIAYMRDAADIQRVLAFFNELDAKVLGKVPGQTGATARAQGEIAARQRAEAARLDLEIKNALNRVGAGLFGDVTGGGSTVGRKTNAPPLGGGGGAGKPLGRSTPLITNPGQAIGITPMSNGEDHPFADFMGPLKTLPESMVKTVPLILESGQRLNEAMATINASIADSIAGLGQTLGDGIYNAFAAAFNGEGVGGILKAFGKTVLAGLGDIFAQQGAAMIKAGIIMQAAKLGITNPFTAAPAMIAAGAALIALGSAFGAIANGGGGRGTAAAGAFRESPGTSEITRLKFIDRPGMASQLAPVTPMHFTVIGENDAVAQRTIGNIVQKYSRRKG
jgi:hypothetical protein